MEDNIKRLRTFKSLPECLEPFCSLSTKGYYFDPDGEYIICYICKNKHKNFQKKRLVELQHLETCKHFIQPQKSIEEKDRKVDKPNYLEMKFTGDAQYRNADANNRHLSFDSNQQNKSNNQKTDFRHYGAALPSPGRDSNQPSQNFLREQMSNLNVSNQWDTSTEDLSREEDRIRTFQNPSHPWPLKSVIDEKELARVGFFYLGLGDRVQCYYCNGILRKWSLGDQPLLEHRKHFPNCPMVQSLT